ncbi:hypothetical protein [Pseudomonas sp. AU11447]|uniref:hypothetical protein n=1 Tax=Pseudomonas sp. AU11447 TaxID=1843184 RepID=UPI000A3F4C60|nr:hypothetical protein [Pseudomonas sp. AU11447]
MLAHTLAHNRKTTASGIVFTFEKFTHHPHCELPNGVSFHHGTLTPRQAAKCEKNREQSPPLRSGTMLGRDAK